METGREVAISYTISRDVAASDKYGAGHAESNARKDAGKLRFK